MTSMFYLILVFVTHDGGMTNAIIPQANARECQINAQRLDKKVMSYGRYEQGVKATCVSGVLK